jgi:hypothetical protein
VNESFEMEIPLAGSENAVGLSAWAADTTSRDATEAALASYLCKFLLEKGSHGRELLCDVVKTSFE